MSLVRRLLPTLALLTATVGCAAAYGEEPPPDSMSAKVPKVKAEAPKPESTEPDPKMDCPWLDHIFDDQPVMSLAENREEFYAYNYFVRHARKFGPEVLAKHTRPELTFRRLFEEPAKYRGEIVRVHGRLKRLTWIGSNKDLESEGLKDLYEAWVFGEHLFSNPTCVILSELPEGVKPAEEIRDVNVAVDGYFFKRYKYRAVNDTRLAPLVIARTLKVTTPPVQEQSPGERAFGRLFLPVVFGSLLAMVGGAFLLHRWFKRGDRKVHAILRDAQSPEFVAPIEGESSRTSVRGFSEN